MNLTHLEVVLWAAGFLGHVALFVILLVRGGRREFPIFTCSIAYQALNTIVLFLIYRLGSHHAYSKTYWTGAVIDFGLELGVMYEITRSVLRPTGTWVRDARKSFMLWAGLMVVVALIAAEMITPPQGSVFSKLEVRGILLTSLLTCELFLAMIMAANRLGLPWRSRVMALGQGLTVWALVALISDLAHIIYGWNRNFIILDYVRMLFYLGALVFWMRAFWLPERARNPLSSDMERYLIAIHKSVQYDLERLSETKKPSL